MKIRVSCGDPGKSCIPQVGFCPEVKEFREAKVRDEGAGRSLRGDDFKKGV
jgi:hypothetical protein